MIAMNKKRIQWIDLIKALGIYLVVLGHSNCVGILRKYIYSFHMPIFYFLGGFTINFNKYNNIIDFIKDKSKKLLLPYLCINLFTVPFYFFYTQFLVQRDFNIFIILKGILIGNSDILFLLNGPTWFLLTLFLSELLFYIIYRIYGDSRKELFSVMMLLILIGYAESITSNNLLMPWHLNCVPIATSFVILGYLFKNYYNENKKTISNYHFYIPVILIFIGGYISVYLNGNVSFGGNNYRSLLLTFTSCWASLFGYILLAIKFDNIKMKFLSFIGKSSIIILALHKPIIWVLRLYFVKFKEASLWSTMFATIIFIAMLPLTYLIGKYLNFLVGDFSKYKKKSQKLIMSLLVIILAGSLIFFSYDKKELFKYKNVISYNNYIAHALGGIDDYAYLNSKESLNNSFKNRFKLYEVDVKLSSDNQLVCIHDWTKEGYKNNLGIKYNEDNPVMEHDDFMRIKIQSKFTPMDFKEIVDFIISHNDTYFMIDIGNKNYDYTKNVYSKIVEEANNNPKVLNHLIVGGHNTQMMETIEQIYPFKIKNLYWSNEASRIDNKINTKEKFLKYCKENGIISLSTSIATYNENIDAIHYFRKNGLYVYLFTENDKAKAEEYLKYVDVVGTDFINLE